MQALSGTLSDRAARAIAAGCDIALHCKGDMDEMIAVAAAAGTMRDDTRLRAARALAARRTPDTVDIAALEADLALILQGTPHV
jgi:beta-N-acetylhexosaminidase